MSEMYSLNVSIKLLFWKRTWNTILGIGGRVLQLMDERGELTGKHTPATDEIEITKEIFIENESDASLDCLMPLFDALWESVHRKRPDYYDLLAVRKVRGKRG
jgi:hypothetical protein